MIATETDGIPCLVLGKEDFEDTKRVIRIRISKKNRQHNGQKIHNRNVDIKSINEILTHLTHLDI
jgi:hypothetical protein